MNEPFKNSDRVPLNTSVTSTADSGSESASVSLARTPADAGQVIGDSGGLESENFDFEGFVDPSAFIWEDGTINPLGTLPGDSFSSVIAINELGQVVGDSYVSLSEVHGFFWNGTTMTDIGTLGGAIVLVEDINDAGQVVGVSETSTPDVFHTFIWDATNGMLDLGTLGGTNSSAISINMKGEIVGDSDNNLGNQHATLWDVTGIFGLPPVANDNPAPSTIEVTPVDITLTASDADGDPLTFSILANPSNGTLSGFNSNTGAVTYTADAIFVGVDSFTFIADDDVLTSSPATVSIDVTAGSVTNTPPIAFNDNYTTLQDTLLNVAASAGVLANDTDADSDPLSAVLVTDVFNGTLSLFLNGSFIYDPELGFSGIDGFQYNATDGIDNSTAFAFIDVTAVVIPPNNPPVALNDTYTIQEETLLISPVSVLANDTDADDDTLSAVLIIGGFNGTLSLFPNGTFTYLPELDFFGIDGFEYVATDGTDNSTAFALITVTNVNDAPTLAAIAAQNVNEGATLNFTISATDPDLFDTLSFSTNATDLSFGAFDDNGDGTGSLEFTPGFTDAGVFALNVTVTDDGTPILSNTTEFVLTVNDVNRAPVANDDFITTSVETLIIVDVLANDTDVDGDTLAITNFTVPANGTAEFSVLTDLSQTINNPIPAVDDLFGSSVSVSGDRILVGTPLDDTGANFAGVAYLFNAATGALLQTFNNQAPAIFDEFGHSVSISGNNVLVGEPFDDTDGTNVGLAYLFDATTGALLQTFNNPTPADDTFGRSVSISGNNVLVGAPGATNAGSAHLFDATTGSLLQTFNNPTPAAGDQFGFSVSISGDNVLVGAHFDDTGERNAGAAYLFSATTGALLQTFNNPTTAQGDAFSRSLSISGDNVLVGALFDDTVATNAGAAYLFSATTGALLQTFNNPIPTLSTFFGSPATMSLWGLVMTLVLVLPICLVQQQVPSCKPSTIQHQLVVTFSVSLYPSPATRSL